MITTKRGRAGSARFSSRTSAGTSQLAYKNQSRTFKTLADAQAAFGVRTPEFWATAWNPNNHFDYEDLLLGNKPISYEQSLNVSGGSDNTHVLRVGRQAPRRGNRQEHVLGQGEPSPQRGPEPWPEGDAPAGAPRISGATRDRGLFGNDNNGSSVYYTMTKMPSFFDFRRQADGTYPFNPFYPSNPFATVDLFQNRETVFRSITTGRVQWEAMNTGTHQVRFVGNVGGDMFTQHNFVYSPPELQYEAQTAIPGTAVTSFSQNLQYNVNVNAVHVFTPNRWLRLTSQVGTQNEYKDQEIARESGQNLLGGLSVPIGGDGARNRRISHARRRLRRVCADRDADRRTPDAHGRNASRSQQQQRQHLEVLHLPEVLGIVPRSQHQTGTARRAQVPRGVRGDGQRAAVRAKVHHAQLEQHRRCRRVHAELEPRIEHHRAGATAGAGDGHRRHAAPEPPSARGDRLSAQHQQSLNSANARADDRILRRRSTTAPACGCAAWRPS